MNNRLSAEDRKEVTVRAVIELCGKEDPARITTATIAKHMGVTQGSLFRHYRNKDEIWEAVVAWAAGKLLQRLDRAVSPTASPLDALHATFLAHIEFIAEFPGVPRLMLGQLQQSTPPPARRTAQTLFKHYRERINTLLMEGQRIGEVASDINIEAATTQFVGTIQGLVVQTLMAGNVEQIGKQAPDVFALYRRGIQA